MLWRFSASILGIMNTDFSIMLKLLYVSVLDIVMKNYVIKFGDVYKISDTAMGKPPAPPWTTIYERIHEDEYIPQWTT